jgi:hypothetical protein
MKRWDQIAANTLESGAIASVATGVMAAACGNAEQGNAIAPINAISHILWGDQAARQNALSITYTGSGLALNTAAVTMWAGVHEMIFGEAVDDGQVAASVLGGAAVAGIAYVIDYHLVPERLMPGFEKRLSAKSLFLIYGALAASLGLGRLILKDRRSSPLR